MKSLQESLLDDEDVLMDETGDPALINGFLNKYYVHPLPFEIIKKGNEYIVNSKGRVIAYQPNSDELVQLTNGKFRFGKVAAFNCRNCKSLKTLEGAPEECDDFICSHCDSLTNLKGSPKIVKETFSCAFCKNLKSLEGCAKNVGWQFAITGCENLKSLKYAPKECDELIANKFGNKLDIAKEIIKNNIKINNDLWVINTMFDNLKFRENYQYNRLYLKIHMV